jgi:hypothetical protein
VNREISGIQDVTVPLDAGFASPPIAIIQLNPLTPELNPSAQRSLTGFFTGDFAS